MDTDAVLTLLQDVAAEVINPRFRSLTDDQVSEKNPGDLVTVADRESEVRITEVRDGVFFATLVFGSGAEVSARPSDSIALALRTGTRIVCDDDVLAEAGLAVPEEQEDEVEKFREFLDHVSPEDFESH